MFAEHNRNSRALIVVSSLASFMSTFDETRSNCKKVHASPGKLFSHSRTKSNEIVLVREVLTTTTRASQSYDCVRSMATSRRVHDIRNISSYNNAL